MARDVARLLDALDAGQELQNRDTDHARLIMEQVCSRADLRAFRSMHSRDVLCRSTDKIPAANTIDYASQKSCR